MVARGGSTPPPGTKFLCMAKAIFKVELSEEGGVSSEFHGSGKDILDALFTALDGEGELISIVMAAALAAKKKGLANKSEE